MAKSLPAKAAKSGPVNPQCSMSNMSNMAFRHVLRFVPAYTLANVECVTPRMGQVARAAVVELAAFRFGITVEPVSGCAWRLLVQEGLASAGCVGLAVGLAHGMLVDPDGRARSWGGGGFGQLGHGPVANVAVPQLITSLATQRVVCVAVGNAHSVIVTEAGNLFSFGFNIYGQLGLGHRDDVTTPNRVAIEAVRSVSAGNCHTAAITREGSLFTWGSNGYGQLGHGNTNECSIPTAVASIAHLTVKQVTAGATCTLVVDAEGSILMAGKLYWHQDGPSSTTFERVQFPDTKDVQPSRFKQVACTSCHALAVTTGGALFSWGRGMDGQLGHGSTEDKYVPRLVRALEGVPISSAAAGAYTSLALARSGEMWSWGEGFALGHGGNADSQQLLPKVIEELPLGASVLRIAAGGGMAACVRADGTTLGWGRSTTLTGITETSSPTPLEW